MSGFLRRMIFLGSAILPPCRWPSNPDQYLLDLVPEGRDPACTLLEESVAAAYRDERLTMEQVRVILGFGTRMQVDPFLQQHEIFDYTVDDLNNDLAGVEAFREGNLARKSA